MADAERIEEIGYINEAREHALISIFNPPLLNARPGCVQVALTIDGAITLRAHLNAFLDRHGIKPQ